MENVSSSEFFPLDFLHFSPTDKNANCGFKKTSQNVQVRNVKMVALKAKDDEKSDSVKIQWNFIIQIQQFLGHNELLKAYLGPKHISLHHHR